MNKYNTKYLDTGNTNTFWRYHHYQLILRVQRLMLNFCRQNILLFNFWRKGDFWVTEVSFAVLSWFVWHKNNNKSLVNMREIFQLPAFHSKFSHRTSASGWKALKIQCAGVALSSLRTRCSLGEPLSIFGVASLALWKKPSLSDFHSFVSQISQRSLHFFRALLPEKYKKL